MNPTLQTIIVKTRPVLQQAGVTHSSIFGSYVRGENLEDSDIDILVDLPKGKTLFDLVDLQLQLKKAIGKEVDLITYNSLHPLLKDRILAEQVRII